MMPVVSINISASPHPSGIYKTILEKASRKVVKSRAHDAAMITKPSRIKTNVTCLVGRILVWTEIDLRGPWLDIESEDNISEILRKEIRIPNQAKPNYRSFDYLFDEITHRMYIEIRNELGQSIGAKTLRNLIVRLTEPDIQGPSSPDIEVTVIPNDSALQKVLKLPGLRSLTIRVVRPNPDETDTEAKRRVESKMENMNVRVLETKLTKSSKGTQIRPDLDTIALAEVASNDGFVRGEGRQDGRKIEAATDQTPQISFVDRNQGDSFFARIAGSFNLRR